MLIDAHARVDQRARDSCTTVTLLAGNVEANSQSPPSSGEPSRGKLLLQGMARY